MRIATAPRRSRAATVPLLVLAALVLAPAPMALAQTRSYRIERFDVGIRVRIDGSLEVQERIRFVFEGAFQGVYRELPLRVHTPWGLNYQIRVDDVAVLDGEGRPLRYERSQRRGRMRIKIWIPGATDTTKQVDLRYRVRRALRFPPASDGFGEQDELYWNVTGWEWSVPIAQATAVVTLPPGVSSPLRTRAFAGPFGSAGEDVTIHNDSARVVFATRSSLPPGDGLTIVVGWPAGVVQRPTLLQAAWELVTDNWGLGLPLVALVLMTALWRRWGRDPRLGRSVMVRYEPPSGLTPAEVGTLADERVDLRDIVASVIDLAVRGYLRIQEQQHDGWLGQSTTLTLHRSKAADEDLRPFERELYEGLFERGSSVQLEDLQTRFYRHAARIREQLYAGLTERGLFRGRPDRVRSGWIVIAVLLAAVSVGLGAILQHLDVVIGGAVSAAVVAAFAWFMPARTIKGRRAWLHIRGFEEFLGRTEREHLESLELPKATFEQFLPYAMALGVADHWTKGFEGLVTEPPSWYAGAPGVFRPSLFGQRMGAWTRTMGTAMTSVPRSHSGTSGFSAGGGFSGGGFGGGGGGAF